MDPAQQQGTPAAPPAAQPAPPPPATTGSSSTAAVTTQAPTAPPQPARTFLNPTMSSAEKSLFPNSLPVRQPLPGIHSFGAAAGTPAAGQAGGNAAAGVYGAQRPGGAPAGGAAKQFGAGASPYGSIPGLTSASPHSTPTPPIIPPANSPPVGSPQIPSAGSPAAARPAAPGLGQPSPPLPSPTGVPSSQPAQQQPQTASAALPSSRSNPMSVSSMLSGPPRDRPVPSYSPLGPSLGGAPATSAAPPQPPVLPPEKKAGSPFGALPGFVQGGVKPPTGTAASGGEKKDAPSTAKPEQPASQVPSQPARSSYPPLPSAFARENPYSSAPGAASTVAPQPKPAAAGMQTANAAAASASASPLAPGTPQSAAAAAQIKNSFFPSLGLGSGGGVGLTGYRPGGGLGRTTSTPTGASGQPQQQQQHQQSQPPAQQYPWQQSHLNPYIGINSPSNTLKQQQQHGRTPSTTGTLQQQRSGAASAASAPAAPTLGGPGAQRQVGQAKPPSPQKQTSGGAAGQRFSSLLSEGPFGGRNGAAGGLGPSPQAQAQIQQQQAAAGANGVKRRRSDAQDQQQQLAHAASHTHSHHQHHHHHSHAQHHPSTAATAAAHSALPPLPSAQSTLPQHAHAHSHTHSHTHCHAHAPTQRVKTASSARGTPPPPHPTTPPLPPPPPFTHADLRKATIHPPLVDVKNEAVDAVMKPFLEKEKSGERPFLGRVVYDPLVDPAKLLDGEVLRNGVGGTIEVVVPTSWLLGPSSSSSPSTSSTSSATEIDLPSIRLSSSIPPTDAHPVALSFGPPSAYTGAPLPQTSSTTPLLLPPHLVDLSGLRKRKVWGTDVYTDDSDVLAVLLHAGWVRVTRREKRLRAGEKGAGADAIRRARLPAEAPPSTGKEKEGEQKDDVEEKVPKALLVTLGVVPPLVRYQGLERQGIRSRNWGNGHDGVSLRVEKVEGIEDIPLPLAHKSRKPSTASFAKHLASLRHGYPLSCAHSISDGHSSHEPPAKRYRFALLSSASLRNGINGDKMDEDSSAGAKVGDEEVIEVTDTFVLDLRTGEGRFVDPEEGEGDEEEAVEGEAAMEVEGVGA